MALGLQLLLHSLPLLHESGSFQYFSVITVSGPATRAVTALYSGFFRGVNTSFNAMMRLEFCTFSKKSSMVMLIDDDVDDCEIFRDAASVVADCKCHCVHDSKEALLILDKAPKLPNCIFLDINMPAHDGFEVLSKIKSNPRLAKIPVVMYSTTSNPQEAARSLQLGAHRFVRKTSDYSKLIQLLKEVKAELVDLR